jgi:hypothetical protein
MDCSVLCSHCFLDLPTEPEKKSQSVTVKSKWIIQHKARGSKEFGRPNTNVNLGVQFHEYGLHIFENLISGFTTINLKMQHSQMLFISSSQNYLSTAYRKHIQ